MKRKAFLSALGFLPFMKSFGTLNTPILSEACKTQKDQEGPFYKAGAPERQVIETSGPPLRIEGKIIKASDCQTPISDAVIDLWHCDTQGNYDTEGFTCRGFVKSDAAGNYNFTTILPPSYGRRPRHIHFKVRAKGFPEFTSQIYFQGDPNLKNDFARNA